MNNFLDSFYGLLFSPDKTFDNLRENPPLFQGFLIVLFISILNPVLNFKTFDGTATLIWLSLSIFGALLFGLLSWLFFAFFLDLVASIFGQSGKIKIFLTLSAFALIPWVFLGPIELLKTAGLLADIFAIFLGLLVWLWVVVLVIKAIIKTYQLSFGKTLTLLIIPSLGGFLTFYWTIGFFSTLFQILKV
ncbi:MAG: hypothetical protein A2287_10310 [Candidatus Melainabacteria bacterium RIFOXYA12_FULL_32_12]|nr:MAG: hypothetical protein A2255_05615 [Candidatus Melainabacteria bacterium RIFOXYA2_FULL_32_9]OGI29175.1 MAG: hypothetical protein A2287_10310 [Candidatus Melainabacteria bacterium RIFOXYA12_FULL_32_12]